MLTGQTGLPPNQPTDLKVKNVHNFDIFQPIWSKFGMESLNGRIRHMYVKNSQKFMKVRVIHQPIHSRPIRGWGIDWERQNWSQINISMSYRHFKGPERAFFTFFDYCLAFFPFLGMPSNCYKLFWPNKKWRVRICCQGRHIVNV